MDTTLPVTLPMMIHRGGFNTTQHVSSWHTLLWNMKKT